MSRTQSTATLSKPVEKYIKWSSANKCFQYQKKNPDESSETKYLTYDLDPKVYVIPIDILYTVKGFNAAENKSYYSNEVRNLKNEPFKVMLNGQQKYAGLWSEISLKNKDLKFVISFYALLLKQDKTTELVNFQMEGSAVGAFIEAKIKDNENNVIEMSCNPTEQKHGATKYFMPMFKRIARSEKNEHYFKEADRVDYEILQPYMKLYFSKEKQENIVNEAAQNSIPEHVQSDSIPAGEDFPNSLDQEDDMPF